jgi:hypothetical protein
VDRADISSVSVPKKKEDMVNELKMQEFSESDFSTYNPDGQLRVQRALVSVQDARRSAMTVLEKERVLRRAEEALALNTAERAAAEANFTKARNRAAHHLREASAKFSRCTLWGMKRVEVQLKLEHALAQFGTKRFAESQAEAERIVSELVNTNAIAPATTTPKSAQVRQSAPLPTLTPVKRSA